MRRMKIPLQDFAAKMQGGAYAQGGHICGTPWYMILDVYLIIYS